MEFIKNNEYIIHKDIQFAILKILDSNCYHSNLM